MAAIAKRINPRVVVISSDIRPSYSPALSTTHETFRKAVNRELRSLRSRGHIDRLFRLCAGGRLENPYYYEADGLTLNPLGRRHLRYLLESTLCTTIRDSPHLRWSVGRSRLSGEGSPTPGNCRASLATSGKLSGKPDDECSATLKGSQKGEITRSEVRDRDTEIPQIEGKAHFPTLSRIIAEKEETVQTSNDNHVCQ